MFIKRIYLNNFRNYTQQSIALEDGINIFYGENAQGKTNIIESIYLSSMGKSHRGSKDNEMIQWDCDEARVEVCFERESFEREISVFLKRNVRKQIKINRMRLNKTSELLGNLNSVIFSPDHMKIIKEGPTERRRFMDMILSQTSKKYLYYLTQYNKILEQRNKLLVSIKKEGVHEINLEVWDQQMLQFGEILIAMRQRFIDRINEFAKEIHQSITDGQEELTLKYLPSVSPASFEEVLAEHRKVDIIRGMTSRGPHRDDIFFYINKKEVKIFGSQGQQRTTLLSLKLAELKYIYKQSGEYPILLLDDVFSELDTKRQNYLIKYIKDIQTIVTCTDVKYFKNLDTKEYHVFRVEKNTVEKEKI